MGWRVMSERELNRIEVLSEVETGRLRAEDAAGLLGLSRRQVFRLLARFRADGPSGLAHKARGRAPNNAIGVAWRAQVLDLTRRPSSLSSSVMRGPAIAAQAAAMLFTDIRQDRHVTPLALRRRPLLPGPEPAVRHRRQAAQTAARQIATVIGNELKLHGF